MHRDTGKIVARGTAQGNGYRTEWYIRCIEWPHERPIPDCPYIVWVKYVTKDGPGEWRVHAAVSTHWNARRAVSGKVKWEAPDGQGNWRPWGKS